MGYFSWTEDYSVNIDIIDEQHNQLISIINELHAAMLKKQSRQAMGHILTQLVEYTNTHFFYEEELMEKYDYPGYREHTRFHDEMKDKVLKLKEDYDQGKIVMSMDVMKFLKEWLSKHIMGTDKLYKDFFNSEGVF